MISSILNESQLRIIYRFLCKFYNLAVTNIENIFYKKSAGNIKIINKGYFSKSCKSLELNKFRNSKKLKNLVFIYLKKIISKIL